MAEIYLAFADTPGLFASIIRHFQGQKYIHVILSLDGRLEEAYSVGRRNPYIPIIAGFEKEDKRKILGAFPTAGYMVCRVECSAAQKNSIRETLYNDYKNRRRYHYAVLGLPFILWNRPFYQKNHYTCSSYIAKVLAENGITVSPKHFSLVTPKDIFEYEGKQVVFEGSLAEFVRRNPCERRKPKRVQAGGGILMRRLGQNAGGVL